MICLICNQEVEDRVIGTHLGGRHQINRKHYEQQFNVVLPRKKAWNRGLTTETNSILKARAERASRILRDGFRTGKYRKWQLGLTKDTCASLKKISERLTGHPHNGDPYLVGQWTKAHHTGKTLEEIYGVEKAAELKLAKSGENNYNWVSFEDRVCACGCNRSFTVKPHSPQRFIYKHSQRGRNNPNWREGLSQSPYGKEFTYNLRRVVRDRDNQTCQICGDSRRRLNVHHIDYDKQNNKLTNLITLCTRCHGRTNYHRDHWIAYFKKVIIL